MNEEIPRLLNQARTSSAVPEDGLDLAFRLLVTGSQEDKLAASEVLIRCSTNRDHQSEARATVRGLCEVALSEDHKLGVLGSLLFFSNEELAEGAAIREFVYSCGGSERWEVRCAASLVIGRFWRLGDLSALTQLERLSKDGNRLVKHNAESALQEL